MGRSNIKEGMVFGTKKSGDCEVISYKNKYEVQVKFLDTGTITTTTAQLLRKGSTLDKYKPSAFGIGYIGEGIFTGRENGHKNEAYKSWSRMLRRCYDRRSKDWKYYGGVGVTVHEDWHNFQNYAEWFYNQKLCKEKGVHLDKDLTVIGNTIYQESCCSLVPPDINCLYIYRPRKKGKSLPEGVYWDKNCNKYRANTLLENGVDYKVGSFDALCDAYSAYKEWKYTHIGMVANREFAKGNIPRVIYENLVSFKLEEITYE